MEGGRSAAANRSEISRKHECTMEGLCDAVAGGLVVVRMAARNKKTTGDGSVVKGLWCLLELSATLFNVQCRTYKSELVNLLMV